MVWLAVCFALASAATTALSTATQHHAAGSAPRDGGVPGLMRHLVRQPAWLLALCLGPIGFGCHALALHFGPIALVQPLAITGLVLAVPVRAAWSRAWPTRAELTAVVVTALAIAALLRASDPQPADRPVPPADLLPAVAVCAAVAVVLLVGSGGPRGATARAQLLGVSAGVLFGLMAVLMEASATYLQDRGGVALALTWLPYAVVVAGLGGITVNQLAYRTARLSASMPVLNVVNCLLTLGFGYLVLHETPSGDAWSLLVCVLALAAMAWGLWRLAQPDASDGPGVSARGRRPRRRTSSTSSPAAPSAPAREASGC